MKNSNVSVTVEVSLSLTIITDRSCLNKGKLHLNRRGSSYLANNFKKFVGSL